MRLETSTGLQYGDRDAEKLRVLTYREMIGPGRRHEWEMGAVGCGSVAHPHPLLKVPRGQGFHCDVCNADDPPGQRRRCDGCDYDVCQRCWEVLHEHC